MKEKTKALREQEETARGGLDQGRRERTSRQEAGCKDKGGTPELQIVEMRDSKYEADDATWPFIKHQKDPGVLWMLSTLQEPSTLAWYMREDKVEGTLTGSDLRIPKRCCCVFRALPVQMSRFGFIWEEPRLCAPGLCFQSKPMCVRRDNQGSHRKTSCSSELKHCL